MTVVRSGRPAATDRAAQGYLAGHETLARASFEFYGGPGFNIIRVAESISS